MLRAALAVVALLLLAVAASALPSCFLSMGDWGHNTPNTSSIGRLMEAAYSNPGSVGCASIDFTLALGDNFYSVGVSSVEDPQWNTTFTAQFRIGALQDVLYYPVLGNHDYMDNGYHAANRSQGLNQVAYHYQKDPKWFLPAPNHTFFRMFNVSATKAITIAFVVIDSEVVHLCTHGKAEC
jgi:tartrate-resistant acid phosphatase type 5